MPKIIGKHKVFDLVEQQRNVHYEMTPSNLIEILGSHATKTDDISVSVVTITPSDYLGAESEEGEIIKSVSSSSSSLLVLQPWTENDHTEYYSVMDFSAPMEIHSVRSNEKSTDSSTITNESYNSKTVGHEVLVLQMGETCIIEPGERYRLVCPLSMYGHNGMPVSYLRVSKPASPPNLDIRVGTEDDTISSSASKIDIQSEIFPNSEDPTNTTIQTTETTATTTTKIEPYELINTRCRSDSWELVLEQEYIVYHMCPKEVWDTAVLERKAYYPGTFEQDGNCIRVAKQPGQLVAIANRFYQQISGDWICLKICAFTLKEQYGILSNCVQQPTEPNGIISTTQDSNESTASTNENNDNHKEVKEEGTRIYGGLPTHGRREIIRQVYPMERNDVTGEFLSISGLGKYVKQYVYARGT